MATELTVLFDGDCGVCTQTARALARLDSRRRLRLISLQEAELPGMPVRDDLEGALHAVDAEGRWYVGAEAGVEIARHVPALRPLSEFARLPLAMPVLDVLYRAIADNRQAISRVLGLNVCKVRSPQP